MAEENDNLEFDLEAAVAAAEEKDKNKSSVETTVTKPDGPTPEETIATLQKQIEEANRLTKETNERLAQVVTEKNTESARAISAVDVAFKEKETAIESRLVATKSSLDSIKQQLKTARTEGNIDAEIELEEKLADERYQLNALAWEKNNLAAQKKQREDAIKNAATQQPNQRQYTNREQEWIDKHPRYNTDDEYQSVVWSLDALAKKRGIRPDTDAYYEFVNKGIEKYFPDETQSTSTSTTTRQAPSASVAAPPSRSASTVQRVGQNGSKVRLTQEQLEAAEACGMTPAEYAQDLINIENEKSGRA